MRKRRCSTWSVLKFLKGPQNTLYGLNTTGGAVNYISKQPEIDGGTQGSASLGFGTNSRVEAELAVGFDITETLAARVAIQSINDDGAFSSISNGKRYGDDDSKAVRCDTALAADRCGKRDLQRARLDVG